MFASAASVEALSDYRLKICFCNGSEAIINMERRIHALRFQKLSDPKLFRTARVHGDTVVWKRDSESVRATVSELLDCMML